MKNPQPIFDPATHYQIELRGRVDVDCLQSFDDNAEIIINENNRMENATVLHLHTDQSGLVRLMRRLHGLGITILRLQIITDGMKAFEAKEDNNREE